MVGLPKIWNYGNYSSDNYGAHSLAVRMGGLTVYFSYKTPIAYETLGDLVCSENYWSSTTGKHLNWIQPDKKQRIPNDVFNTQLIAELEKREKGGDLRCQ